MKVDNKIVSGDEYGGRPARCQGREGVCSSSARVPVSESPIFYATVTVYGHRRKVFN